MDALPSSFDVLILGTSLPQAILAAALATAGHTVLHVDPSPSYGSHHASLTTLDLLALASPSPSPPPSLPPYLAQLSLHLAPGAEAELRRRSREYALALQPMLVRSFSPLVDVLVASGLSAQASFQLLQGLFLYTPPSPATDPAPAVPTSSSSDLPSASASTPTSPPAADAPPTRTRASATKVPASKESIFTSPLPLLSKRKLMRFLLWAASPQHAALEDTPELQGREDTPLLEFLTGQFGMDDEGARALTYAVAHRTRAGDPALPGLRVIRQHLLGTGRYGPSAYLVGQYGGAGELAQLFCRMAAVRGTPYILQHAIDSLVLPSASAPEEPATIKLHGIDEPFRAKQVVLEPALAPASLRPPRAQHAERARAQCLAILEETIVDEDESPDTALLVFPPGALGSDGCDRAVTALWTGEGSKSTPSGRYVVYLSVPCDADGEGEAQSQDAQALLEPYLNAFLQLTGKPEQTPLLTMYYKFVDSGSHEHAGGEGEGSETETEMERVYVLGWPGDGLIDGADRAAEEAEAMFRKVVGEEAAGEGMWAGLEEAAGEEEEGGEGSTEDW